MLQTIASEADGGYWNDDDHYEIFVSQAIVDKYKLGDDVVDPIEEWFEDEEDAAEEWEEKLASFSNYIIQQHCWIYQHQKRHRKPKC